jgi:hypothetical protein
MESADGYGHRFLPGSKRRMAFRVNLCVIGKMFSVLSFCSVLCWLLIVLVLSRHRMAELADGSPQSAADIPQAAGAKDDEDNDQDDQQFGQAYSL